MPLSPLLSLLSLFEAQNLLTTANTAPDARETERPHNTKHKTHTIHTPHQTTHNKTIRIPLTTEGRLKDTGGSQLHSSKNMATRGVFQLRTLTLSYCEHGGSSKAVRDFLASGKLIEWASERPSVEIKVCVRNGKHPNAKGEYLTGVNGSVHQVCLKSNAARSPEIESILDMLFNRSGRKITKFTKSVYSDTPSIQGMWTPALNLHLQPEFPMKMTTIPSSSEE